MVKGLRSSLGIVSATALIWLMLLDVIQPGWGTGTAMICFLVLAMSEYPQEVKHDSEQSSGGNGRGELSM